MFKPVTPQVDFVALEKEIFAYWEKNNIVKKYLAKNSKSRKTFSFLDGPITANNPMGVHHAWGRTYKDLWQRYHNMAGFKQRFQNGFDCQGLWVEVEVEKELGFRTKKDIEKYGVADFVNKCKERVMKFSKIQTEQSRRLGYFMDWDNSYFTMSDQNNYMIWHLLKVCWERGWIYKGHDVVPWCPRCETAISQHEILTEDYQEVSHETVFLRFPIEGREREYLTVWTTTPWTVPANTAVAVGKGLNYALVEVAGGDKYYVAAPLVESVFKNKDKKVLKTLTGEKLVGLKYSAPFDHLSVVKKAKSENPEKFHRVVATDDMLMPISTTEGTGLVHTSPSTGEEDFKLGKKLGLPLVTPVIADNADYADGLGDFTGKNAKKHPEIILDYLKAEGKRFLLKTERINHRYPRCWRCKAELVWKIADEWYIAMDIVDPTDKLKRTLRQQIQDTTRKIKWHPSFGLERELDWLKNMHDWLISKKNRYWGLALPIYECKKCGNFEVIGGKEELEKRAISGFDKFSGNSPHKPWIDKVKIKCSKCKSVIDRIDDVGNPWLDAGIVSFSTITGNNRGEPLYTIDKKEWQKWFPADFITESFPGQFKNWFYSLLVMGTILEKTNPFKTVLGFATLSGEDGRPMHKSWGNSIEFNEGADTIGADVMRWMFVKQDPQENMLFGYKKADETRRKFQILLWNVYNFFVTFANIDNFKPEKTDESQEEHVLDIWIISKLNSTIETVTASLNSFDARSSALSIEDFVIQFSQWYLRRSRDRVGPAVMGNDKQNCYQTLFEVFVTLTKLLAPFVPFLSEKLYLDLLGGQSVHLTEWPMVNKKKINPELETHMTLIRQIIEKGHAERKEKQIKVRQPLLKMDIPTDSDYKKIPDQVWQLVLDELNIKNLFLNGKIIYPKIEVILSQKDLDAEGEARGIIRKVQIMRKEAGMTITDKINLVLPVWPEKYTDFIKKETLAEILRKGEKEEIFRV